MRIRRIPTILCLLSAACATAGGRSDIGSTLVLKRPDGVPAVCTKPPEQSLDAQEGVGVAAAVPDLVQLLTASSTSDGRKLDAIVRDAPTPAAFAVLDYRLCLEYGNGTLTRDVYVQWLLDLRPRAYQAMKGLTGSG